MPVREHAVQRRSQRGRGALRVYRQFASLALALHEARQKLAESAHGSVSVPEMMSIIRGRNSGLSETDLSRIEINADLFLNAGRRIAALKGVPPKKLFELAFGQPYPNSAPDSALQVRFSPHSVNFWLDTDRYDFKKYLRSQHERLAGFSSASMGAPEIRGMVNVVFSGEKGTSRHESRHTFNRLAELVLPHSEAQARHPLFRGEQGKIRAGLESFLRDELSVRAVPGKTFQFDADTFDYYVNNFFGIPQTPEGMNEYLHRILNRVTYFGETPMAYVSSQKDYARVRKESFRDNIETAELLRPIVENAAAAIREAQKSKIPRQVLADFVAMVPLTVLPKRLPKMVEAYLGMRAGRTPVRAGRKLKL